MMDERSPFLDYTRRSNGAWLHEHVRGRLSLLDAQRYTLRRRAPFPQGKRCAAAGSKSHGAHLVTAQHGTFGPTPLVCGSFGRTSFGHPCDYQQPDG